MKYTALDILKSAGVETPEEKIGKVRVRIAGVPVRKPDALVNLQDATTCSVIVGNDKIEDVPVPEATEEVKANTKAALEKKGAKASERFEAQQRAKAEAGAFGSEKNAERILEKRLGKKEEPKAEEKPKG